MMTPSPSATIFGAANSLPPIGNRERQWADMVRKPVSPFLLAAIELRERLKLLAKTALEPGNKKRFQGTPRKAMKVCRRGGSHSCTNIR